jgi:hypothetical protein
MLNKLTNLFGRPEVIKLIEVDKLRTPFKVDGSGVEQIQTLVAHPGFQLLLSELRTQRGFLEAKLLNEAQKTLREVQFIQSGIYWSKWLETKLTNATVKHSRVLMEPTVDELAAFREIDAALQRVGADL